MDALTAANIEGYLPMRPAINCIKKNTKSDLLPSVTHIN